MMTEAIWFFNYCTDPKMLMFAGITDTTTATGCPVLTNLAPPAVSTASLPSNFSKSGRHDLYTILHYKQECVLQSI
jgi:hypothetical protein